MSKVVTFIVKTSVVDTISAFLNSSRSYFTSMFRSLTVSRMFID